MIFTTVTIRRGASGTVPTGGTVVATPVSVQIDEMSPMLAQESGFGHAFDLFEGYILYMPPTTTTRRGDAWIDQVSTDPLTGNPMFYQVVGRPETFTDGHVECTLRVYEGAA